MSLGRLILAGLRQRPVMYGLNLLGLSLGVALVVALVLGSSQLQSAATAEARGVDLVIGATGSPLQLVLSSVYHADAPTGNIPASQWMRWRAHPLVQEAVPLAMGDFVSGYRLVGTARSFADFFHLSLAAGSWWEGEGAVVVGSSVARELTLGVGDAVVASHGGDGPGVQVHHEHPLRVSGVLAPTGRVIDRLVLTDLRTYWHLHGPGGGHGREGEDLHDHSHDHSHDGGGAHHHSSHPPDAGGGGPPSHRHHASATPGSADYAPSELEGREVTGLLVQYASPLAAGRLAREVSAQPRLQAASPAEEMARLLTVFGGLLWAAQALAFLVLAVSALGLLVAIHQSLEQRRYDMALLRVMGAGRVRVGFLLVGEAILVGTGAALLGLLLGHLGVEAAARMGGGVASLPLSGLTWTPAALWVFPLAWVLGLMAAAPAAWRVFRMEVADVLARGG